jgi:glycine betaine/choline ABC-type transport system substrate-binding protein/ABC-type proline/glycine betaine transport system permease subunit
VEADAVIDALDYLISERESVGGGVQVGGSHLLGLLGRHLLVTLESVLVACAVAIPAAVWLAQRGRGQLAASTLANVGRAIPTFAVLAITSVYLGYNTGNLVLAMALLALPPIFTNAYVGVRQVEPDVVDAARGMGMRQREIARHIQLPLAAPLIFGGVRTSTVNVLATATLGPFFGVATLGEPIINANVHGEAGRLGTAILVAALAVAAELLLATAQRGITPRGLKLERPMRRSRMKFRTAMPAVVAALALGIAACGDDEDEPSGAAQTTATQAAESKLIERNPENTSKPAITVGSKNFTEEFILGEIYAQALKAAGYKVKKQLNLGSEQIALKAVKSGRVDGYPEYTGTALTSFFKVKTDDVPKDAQQAYQQAKAEFAKQGIVAFAPTPFTDSNGFAMTREGAQKAGGATKLSDLAEEAGSLTLSGPPECAQRTDCKLGLEQVYGLKFKKFTSIDLAKRHEVLKSGQADVGLVFTTDGQIKAENLVLLQDDKQLFPPYNVSFVVRQKAVDDAGPEMQTVIERVQEGLTTEVMQELNSRVDLDKEKPEAVAEAYLRESGYIE